MFSNLLHGGDFSCKNQQASHFTVFLTQIISCQRKNADTKVAQSISRRQKWDLHWQFSKNSIFPNIQLKGFVNRLPPFKSLLIIQIGS